MYIGIDLGTTGVKLLLLSTKGEVVKTVSKGYELLIPEPLWTEQDPNTWYEQTQIGLTEICKGYEKDIKAISFSGQMHGMVLLDEFDEVIRPAILWNDQRTTKEVDYLNDVIGIEKLQYEIGNIALTGLTAPKVLWVFNNEPANFKRISKVMLPKDYLAYKLSGVFATDVSDVSGTLYYDVKNKKYSQYMLNLLHINESQLPKVFESYEKIGELKKEISQKMGLLNQVDIIIGGGDQAVGAVGVGIVNEGKCNISLGTSGVVFTAMDYFAVDKITHLQSYAGANGKYHMMGVMLNAAGALKWWNEGIFKQYNYNDVFKKLINTPIEDDLYFLPYLSGERSPINDSNAKGLYIGLRLEHKKEHLDRAVVEGISFNLKRIFENIKDKGANVDSVRVTGGGAKSTIWPQMLSEILNTKIETIQVEEGPALGAAILSMVGSGLYETVEAACNDLIKVKKVYMPDIDNVKKYEKKFKAYEKIYPVVKTLF